MTRQGKVAMADGQAWGARRLDGQAFRKAAAQLMERAVEGQNCNPIIVLVVHAAIAYGDALAARFGGVINRDRHDEVIRRVEDAMKGKADPAQMKRLAALLSDKTTFSYGSRIGRMEDARDKLTQLVRFETWAEEHFKP